MRRKFAISIFLLLFIITATAQDYTKIKKLQQELSAAADDTSKANALNQLCWQYHNTNTDTAIYYVKAALLLGEKAGAFYQMATSKYYLGRLLYNKSDDENAMRNFDEALLMYQKLHNIVGQSTAHMYKGYVYLRMSRNADVLREFLLCLKYAEQSGDKKTISDALYCVGDYYLHKNNASPDTADIVKARGYFLHALNIDEQLNLKSNIATDYQYLGNCDYKMKNYSSSEKNLLTGIKLFKELGDNLHLAAAYSYLGNMYGKKGDADLSIENYQKAENLFEKLGSSLEAADVADNMTSEYIEKRDYHNALITAQKGLEFAKQANEHMQLFYLYTSLSNISAALKDFSNAYNYQLKATALKDSINKKEQRDKMAELQTQYETESKDKTIKLLNTQAKLDKEQISRQHIIELFSVISIVLVIILSVVLLNRNRMRQQLTEVNVRNQLAADLHDEVGSSLSSILLLSKMAAAKNNELENKNNMLEKISGNTKEVIDKMGDIVWMMNPKYDEGENLREKLEQYVIRIKEVAAFETFLEIDAAVDAVKFPMEMRKAIFLICKEALNNTIKYAEAVAVSIKLQIIEKNIRLTVTDIGKGFNQQTIAQGNGLGTMELRTKNCGGQFLIYSEAGKGTEVTATMPIPHFRYKA